MPLMIIAVVLTSLNWSQGAIEQLEATCCWQPGYDPALQFINSPA